ncbi:MAG TPA: hypothetical protein VGK02_09600 [Candidatus Aquicultor sp.]|jgi:hypothetical protein
MPESRLREAIQDLVSQMSENILIERMDEYIIRQLKGGRQLSEILEDPYVKDNVDENRLEKVLENKDLMQAFEERIKESFPV